MKNIERYKQLEEQIKWVNLELMRGEYKAAGLSVDISIGEEEQFQSFSFGVYSGIEKELLELILRGLEETKGYILKNIVKEQQELNKFMESL